jgi:ADP-ribosylglycohydrolase
MLDEAFVAREESFTGCLIGQCLGDALGFPVEGDTPQSCREYVADTMTGLKAGSRRCRPRRRV